MGCDESGAYLRDVVLKWLTVGSGALLTLGGVGNCFTLNPFTMFHVSAHSLTAVCTTLTAVFVRRACSTSSSG